ncbi:MAG: family 16 glycosylhydrolase, partial [Ferruginibacter sp.]
ATIMLKQKCFYHVLAVFFCVALLSCKKKDAETTPAILPVVKIEDATQARTAVDGMMHFNVTLNKTSSVPVTVDYTLIPGTAIAPDDYTATSGTLTIAANQVQAQLDVQVKGDPTDTRKNNPQFTVQLSNAKACVIGIISAKGTIITENGTNLVTDESGYTTPLAYAGYNLAWSDEFSGSTINQNNWNFETGGGGWGNHELENYTGRSQNAFQSNGKLIIEARSEAFGGNLYTSARMTTQNKKLFKFGRIDIRAKLPVTKGMWPALWMLGANIGTVPWPACGETDIMEVVGSDPSKLVGTGHFANSTGGHDSRGSSVSLNGENFSQKFHVFSIIWQQDSIKWLLDDQVFYTLTKASTATNNYPFNNEFFFIVNVAVGGDWPGPPDGTTNFPQRMFVDYIRVFQ